MNNQPRENSGNDGGCISFSEKQASEQARFSHAIKLDFLLTSSRIYFSIQKQSRQSSKTPPHLSNVNKPKTTPATTNSIRRRCRCFWRWGRRRCSGEESPVRSRRRRRRRHIDCIDKDIIVIIVICSSFARTQDIGSCGENLHLRRQADHDGLLELFVGEEDVYRNQGEQRKVAREKRRGIHESHRQDIQIGRGLHHHHRKFHLFSRCGYPQ